VSAPREFIPEHLAELTPQWLTETLAANGSLHPARTVMDTRATMLGDGEGFLGDIVRLDLILDEPCDQSLNSLIVKLPKHANRAFGEMLGAYEREILFYREMAPNLPTRTPEIYYGALDRDAGSEKQAEILAVLDKLPLWMNRSLASLGLWVASRKQRRYLLLMEDLRDIEPGDQIQGASLTDTESVIRTIARTHAQYWNSPELENRFWLISMGISARMRYGMFRNSLGEFRERFSHLFAQGMDQPIDWLIENGADLTRALVADAPETLVHGDLRLDNLFFPGVSTEEPVVIDWQLVQRGPGIYDVAYLISCALDPATTDAEVTGLLEAYRDALAQHDVTNYPFEALARDYKRSMLAILQTLATTGQVEMGEGDDRGVALIDLWIERLFARVTQIDLRAVL
jgi:thiamine kinase-like enzyme